MAHLQPQNRLAALARAATGVYGRLGYRGTATADVSAQSGKSSGSVLNYVQSKEAPIHLVFACGLGQLTGSLPTLPLSTPVPGGTLALIERGLISVPTPKLRGAIRASDPPDIEAELRGIVEDDDALVVRIWPMLSASERCAAELPDLADAFYRRTRTGHFGEGRDADLYDDEAARRTVVDFVGAALLGPG